MSTNQPRRPPARRAIGLAAAGVGVVVVLVIVTTAGHHDRRHEAVQAKPASAAPTTTPPPTTAIGVVPLHDRDFVRPVATYRAAITAGLAMLARDTDALRSTVATGNMTATRSAWLVAHLDYERLGAAYDAFGDFDGEINGRPDGLPKGIADPGFTGFLRLEYGLWHAQPWPVLNAVATRLDQDVHGLQADFPSEFINAPDLPLRAHEILENGLQFELTGDTDQGSGTNLATLLANVEGTRTVLAALAPLLDVRAPSLVKVIDGQLGQLTTTLGLHHHPTGRWDPVGSLTRPERERLDSELSGVLENLAHIPFTLPLAQS